MKKLIFAVGALMLSGRTALPARAQSSAYPEAAAVVRNDTIRQSPRPEDSRFYLFYNLYSGALDPELGIGYREARRVFDDQFGEAAEQLPLEVRAEDFYIAKYPDQSYVFILNAKFNCAEAGCATERYTRDSDGDLYYEDSSFPVKCKLFPPDKLLCIKGGYRPGAKPKPKADKPRGKRVIHYLAPKES